ncbi:MAG: lytic murein transglycosylase B [Pseudomonadales bacterium]|nr:lytic murein transglycosylase B [Pseudomonadales bacterium]
MKGLSFSSCLAENISGIRVVSRTGGLSGVIGFVLMLFSSASCFGNYTEQPEVQKFIDEVAENHAFEHAWLLAQLAKAERQQKILDAISRPAERVLEWKDYRKIFMTEDRIQGGKAFLETHKSTFNRMEREFGVPKEVVAAIIGVETRYGKFTGKHRVIDALATLAFDYPPRSDFFRSELEHFFLLSREQGFDPQSLTGSYAGAMGYGQFISSSYRNFAVDFDDDGVVDILHNPVDAIGSVANYFVAHKWQRKQQVVLPVTVQGSAFGEFVHKDLKPKYSWGTLKKAGVTLDTADPLPDDTMARLMPLQGESGTEYWLALDNFYTITRYNHSELYAMAVFQLSQALK